MLVLEDPQLTTVPCVPREEPHVWGKAVWGWGKLWIRRLEAKRREAVSFLSLAPTFQGWFLLRQGIDSIIHDDYKHSFLDIYRKENLRSSPDRSRSDRTPNVSLGSPSVLTPRTQRRRLRLQCRNQGCNVFFMTSRTRDRHESSASCLFRDSAALQVFYKTL